VNLTPGVSTAEPAYIMKYGQEHKSDFPAPNFLS
jgi:hypothetical protein